MSATEKTNDAELIAQKKLNSKLLESEKKYLAEKEKLKKQEAEAEEAIRKREYIEKLATAKNNLAIEKAMRNESLRLQKKSNEEYLSELKLAAEREREVINQLKDDISEAYENILSFADDSIVETEKKRDKMEEKLKSYGNLTKKVIFHGAGENGADEIYTELSDLDKTTEKLNEYAKGLEKLREKMETSGFSFDEINAFVAEISGFSVDKGAEFTSVLNAKGDDEFSHFIQSWILKQRTSEALSAQLYESQMEKSVSDTISYMTAELEKMGLSVPDGFFLSGSVSAEKFGEGFAEKLSEELLKIKDIIDGFNVSLNLNVNNAGESKGTTTIYSPKYEINSSGGADVTLQSLRAMETRKILSGVMG